MAHILDTKRRERVRKPPYGTSVDVSNAALRVTKMISSAVSVLVVVAMTEPGTAGDRSGAASGAAASPPRPR